MNAPYVARGYPGSQLAPQATFPPNQKRRAITMAAPAKAAQSRGEPVYEKLGKDECLIIEKRADSLLVACNEGGKIVLKRVEIPK